jgi:ketosteroid isomerase-like protein
MNTPTTTGTARTEATRALVLEFMARLGAADHDGVAALFSERVDWRIAPNPSVPWVRPRATRADVAKHFAEMRGAQYPEDVHASLDSLLASDTEAIAMGTVGGRVRATGRAFSTPYAVRFTVADGEITGYHIVEDSLAVAAACEPREER